MFHDNALLDALLALFVAAFGGVIRVIIHFRQYGWKDFLKGALVSAFAGSMVHLLISDFAFLADMEGIKGMLVGMAGYSGSQTLSILDRFTQNQLENASAHHHKQGGPKK